MVKVMTQREPLSKDRVLRTAVTLADTHGIEAVTMRRLAAELGVEAMSLYHYVPNKEALLDGVVDLVFAEIDEVLQSQQEAAAADWKNGVRSRILTSRSVLLRHTWAPALIESRPAAGLPMTRYMDGVIRVLHAGGLSYDLVHHGMHAMGSRAMGFVHEIGEPEGSNVPSAEQLGQMEPAVPNIVAMLRVVAHDDPATTLGWCDDQTEFEFGLDLILDGLERVSRENTGPSTHALTIARPLTVLHESTRLPRSRTEELG
jgi:AcrR family transcriptional regulator